MARIKLDVPQVVHYTTEIPVRVTDINYGGHLGNDALLSLMHEARVRFLDSLGYSELNVENSGIIMNDAAIVYKSEGFQGDMLVFALSVVDFHSLGCDIFYKITNTSRDKLLALAKTGIVFYDYAQRKPVEVPAQFRARFTS